MVEFCLVCWGTRRVDDYVLGACGIKMIVLSEITALVGFSSLKMEIYQLEY